MQHSRPNRFTLRLVHPAEFELILALINAAAEAYRGVIPEDCWREPYMSGAELRGEIAAGVDFAACEIDGSIAGVMGVQPVRNVVLIRHAYVAPAYQRAGVGSALLEHLAARIDLPILIGTWAAASWAVGFYERHGFVQVSRERATELLHAYWSVSARQIETSVVLARPALDDAAVERLKVESAAYASA